MFSLRSVSSMHSSPRFAGLSARPSRLPLSHRWIGQSTAPVDKRRSAPSQHFGFASSVSRTGYPIIRLPLFDRNELRPVLHLHALHEPILAVLGLENRCFAFLHIEPVLAQGIDDVGLVRDEEGVFAPFGPLRQHLAKCRGSPARKEGRTVR